MREILCEVAKRLGEAPDRAAELVLKRAEVSDALHRVLDSIKQKEAEVAGEVAAERNGDGKPKFPNEASRNAETARRLQADASYREAKAEADRLRAELREIDAEIERAGRRHWSDANLAYLAANLLAAGMREEFEAVLKAYAGAPAGAEAEAEAKAEAKAEARVEAGGNGLETGTFRVLEARANEKGVVRAWCEGPEGRVAVFAKDGAAKALSGAVGKRVTVRFRRLDKGLFAVSAEGVA